MRYLDNPMGALGAGVVESASNAGGHDKMGCEALAADIADHQADAMFYWRMYKKCVESGECTSTQLEEIARNYNREIAGAMDAIKRYGYFCGLPYGTVFRK